MIIEISDKAKSYLESKDVNEITVDLIMGGNEIMVGEPKVIEGKPTHIHEKYDTFEVDGYVVHFYEHPSVAGETVTIDAKSFLGRESLKVKGLKYM